MNEPKKRGRPSKAEIAARDAAKQAPKLSNELDPGEIPTDWLNPGTHTEQQSAQAYALRVWHGQSPNADRPWRIERVKQALEAQGLSMEGVELP